VQIVDEVTMEVVKEIPNKKFLDMYAEMIDFMGIFVDKKI
jgi:flagellar protein FlaG